MSARALENVPQNYEKLLALSGVLLQCVVQCVAVCVVCCSVQGVGVCWECAVCCGSLREYYCQLLSLFGVLVAVRVAVCCSVWYVVVCSVLRCVAVCDVL